MKTIVAAITVLASVTACSGASEEPKARALDSTDYAYKVCSAVDSTGMSTKPCNVNSGRYIDITANIGAGEAERSCSEIRRAAIRNGWTFESFWEVRFFTPYASNGPIVTCSFS